MPVIFIGHGSPENAFTTNEFNKARKDIATTFAEPKAIIVISAHRTNYMIDDVEETAVTMPEKQKTIHDFYGFPKKFYEFLYTAPGNPKLAEEIIKNIKAIEIRKNTTRGLDHGTRSVLAQMYPQANIPTIQLSIDEDLPREKMFEVGKELGKLREQGILILGSGNIVHNLGAINRNGEAYPRAIEFDQYIASALQKKEYQKIFGFEQHPNIHLTCPTVDHFLPLLYVIGAAEGEEPKFFCEKIFAGSLSMRCVIYQAKKDGH